jgi:hypothetical protein
MPQRSSKGALVLGGRTGPVVSRMVHAPSAANGGTKGGDTGKSWDDEDVRLVSKPLHFTPSRVCSIHSSEKGDANTWQQIPLGHSCEDQM